jgi:cell fate (sporulation/competence/biofilm development) regulator YlbF (YheA/YmcA/DUF963 family)
VCILNVYDKAYELKSALMDSMEVKEYKEAAEKIKANPTNKKMVEDFRNKQMEIQAIQFSGKQPEKEKLDQLEKLYNIISINSDINRFLQCEYKFSIILNDVTKIISEAVDVNLGFEDSQE